jgi:hypothetical protein
VVFQKKSVSRKLLRGPGRGGLPNPTESTMWGKGSPGVPTRGDSGRRVPTEARGRAELLGPTGPD